MGYLYDQSKLDRKVAHGMRNEFYLRSRCTGYLGHPFPKVIVSYDRMLLVSPCSRYLSIRFSASLCAFERHKRTRDFLALRKLLFTVEMKRLQDWPITNGEQIRSFKRLVVNTCPGRDHEEDSFKRCQQR